MTFLPMTDVDRAFFDAATMAQRGDELAAQYRTSEPFAHVVIDDFLPPEALDRCLTAFPTELGQKGVAFERPTEYRKSSFNPDELSTYARTLFYSFNSQPFITFVEHLTGITGLIPDPHFVGAGFHELTTGGYLNMHADFNHHRPLDLERRINALIYLNHGWTDEYGGQLELWKADMSHQVVSVVPVFNRCVIFNTTSDSIHGNPTPVNHPDGRPRRSIALYYYTATWDESKGDHTTKFRARPGTSDDRDRFGRLQPILKDLVPPLLQRQMVRVRRRLRK